MNFLATLRKMGMAIKVFDLIQWYVPSAVPMDVKKLDEVSGLKVIWREGYGMGNDYNERAASLVILPRIRWKREVTKCTMLDGASGLS